MASQQERRENVTDEREINLEKNKVPQIASHFESLAEKVQAAADVHPAGPGAVHVKSTVTVTGQGDQGAHEKKSQSHEQESQQMQQARREKEGDIQRKKLSSTLQAKSSEILNQGRKQQEFEERPGGVKFEVQGQEHKGSDTGRETEMQKQEGESRGRDISSMQQSRGVATGGQQETETQARGEGESRAGEVSHGTSEETKGPSLEEISQYRGTAQQNSMEAIRAAEERYEKAKEKGGSTLQNVKESATHGLGAAGTYATEAKDTVTQGVQKGTQYVAEKAGAAKETALEKGQQAYAATKDTLSSAGQTAVQSAQQAKDYVAQKAGETKEYVVPKTEEKISTAGEVETLSPGEIASVAKECVQEKSKSATSYVGEKAAKVKDITVETGKGAVGYAGKVAETVKEKAVVAGWGAAHFTAEKAADATKAVAGVASSVAGYAGDKAVAAKDVVADVGKKTVGYAEDKLVAAKDYVVSAEESAAEYAARKKAEAERESEAKRSHDTKEETKVEEKESGVKPMEKVKESIEEESGGGGEKGKQLEEGAAVVLQAIGETIVEIGKTTTDLVAGHTRGEESVGTEKSPSQ
ncbi:PREDICTED: seed biotin-containing protein SBP65-like isoform X1 [Nicotiana attenuata]|nr:PREDICTED: seed biotin-containing protein SBP65-like isoform X1 [Nicotiana attenuata]